MKEDKDKYLIYRMKGRNIRARMPARLGGNEIVGFCNNVERDVINNKIVLTINGSETYSFKEPRNIKKENDNAITFMYGDMSTSQIEDDELFTQLRNGGYIDDILRKNVAEDIFCIGFSIMPVVEEPTPNIQRKKRNTTRRYLVKARKNHIKRKRVVRKNVKKKSKRTPKGKR